MLCDICLQGLEGIWDPSKSKRLGATAEVFGASEDAFDPANLPPGVRIEKNERITAQKLEPELYVFGHHIDLESFKRSIRRGCVMCNRFQLLVEGVNVEENPKLTSLGYFSVFTVSLTTSRRLMTVRYGDVIGGFEIEPYTGMNPLVFPSFAYRDQWHELTDGNGRRELELCTIHFDRGWYNMGDDQRMIGRL